jgi:O-acetylhomoserine (thiol)-lyase
MTPDTAAAHSLGLETLEVRYERMSRTAEQLAGRLENHPRIAAVGYPTLASSPFREVAARIFTGRPGAMFTATLDSREECFRFMDALQIWNRATNLFDNRSLVIHPASTIYAAFTPEARRRVGVDDRLVRFSAGLEDAGDLAADIERALDMM